MRSARVLHFEICIPANLEGKKLMFFNYIRVKKQVIPIDTKVFHLYYIN